MKNTFLSPSSYDPIAEMYHKLWADWYLPAALPALERLFFSRVPERAKVLDVCCGSGHVTRELITRGYSITAVDASAELIAIARKDWPGVDWRVQDARHMDVGNAQYGAAISTFDSLNHLASSNDLEHVFKSVHRALQPGGLFVFDMNLEEAFLSDHRRWTAEVTSDYVSLVRGFYDELTKVARTELIWFVPAATPDTWRQHRSTVEQRSFPEGEITSLLAKAGFGTIEVLSAADAGMAADLGYGRIFISARA
ncbi:MAG: class I SAM-dependent DNA methyltransferase [Bryobacteraceae bacterium]